MIEGFDSRYWNGHLPAQYNFQFFMGKATESDYFVAHNSPYQIEMARRYGMDAGVYHFYRQHCDITGAANIYYHWCKPLQTNIKLPILDCEDQSSHPGTALSAHLWASVQEIEAKFGQMCMIYTARWWWDSHVYYAAGHPIYQRPLWEADPPPDTATPGSFANPVIVQYKLSWRPPGLNASIDLDRADEAWYRVNVDKVPF